LFQIDILIKKIGQTSKFDIQYSIFCGSKDYLCNSKLQ
jgi:hypothetical protein